MALPYKIHLISVEGNRNIALRQTPQKLREQVMG